MSAYLADSTLVLRPLEHDALDPAAAERTRFTVVATSIPADGPAQCSVCPESGRIGPAIGGIRYRSAFLGGWADEPVCLSHLPELIETLTGRHGEGPLTAALYSPCPDANGPRVRRLNHERAWLVGRLLETQHLPYVTVMLGQLYAAASAQLRKIAEVA